MTRYGENLLPTEEENCLPITVTEEDMRNSVKVVPKIETLVSKSEKNHIAMKQIDLNGKWIVKSLFLIWQLNRNSINTNKYHFPKCRVLQENHEH